MPVDADAFRAFERAAHNRLAESYAEFFTPITELAIGRLLDAAKVGPATRVLDVATGPGPAASAALARGADPVGIDLAPRMIELARSLHPGIEFSEGNVESLPFPDLSFDAVVCNFGLGHFPRPEHSLAEGIRVLRPSGSVALSWWDDLQRQRVQGLFREAIAQVGVLPPADVPQGHPVFRFSDTGEFERLLQGAGLNGVTVEDHQTSYFVPDVDTLWRGGLGSLAVTAATIRSQGEPVQRKVRAAFERLTKAYQTSSGLEIPIAFKIGAGRKRA